MVANEEEGTIVRVFFESCNRYAADMTYAELLDCANDDTLNDDPAEFLLLPLAALQDGQEHELHGVPGQLICSILGDYGTEIDGDVPTVTGIQVIKRA